MQARRDVSQEGGSETRKGGDCGSPRGSVAMVARSSYTFGGCVGGCVQRKKKIGTETGDKWPYWKLVEISEAVAAVWGRSQER